LAILCMSFGCLVPLVTVVDFGYPVYVLWLSCSHMIFFIYWAFQSFDNERNVPDEIISETRLVH
jgi:hypothetical protein